MASKTFSLLLAMPVSVLALTPMDDAGLSQVNGRDGLTVNLESSSGINAESLTWETDEGTAQEALTRLSDVSLDGNGSNLSASWVMDVSHDGTDPLLSIQSQWGLTRLIMGGMSIETPTNTSSSMGQAALYSQGSLNFINRGIFDNDGNKAKLAFDLNGDWIYRQGGPGSAEISFGNLEFTNRFTTGAANSHADGLGTIAIDNTGIKVASSFTESILQFDLMYNDTATDFDTSGRTAMMHAGWIGGLTDTLVRVSPGGVGVNALSPKTQGLSVLTQWGFDSDFILNLGHAGGNDTQLQFRDWRHLGNGSGPMLKMEMALDVLQDGAGSGGLCFGVTGQTCVADDFYDTRADAGESAFAILLRDSYLRAYSESIAVDSLANVDSASAYDWSVILTMGLLESDILVYPGGPYAEPDGFRLDAALMVQSPGYWDAANSNVAAMRDAAAAGWETNSHFLFADMGADVAIGLMNVDVLWNADDLYLVLGQDDPAFPDLPSGMMLSTDVLSRYQVRGLLGAGSPSDLGSDVAKIALWDLNLSANQFRFVLYPTTASGSEALGFDAFMNLDGSSYLTLAEVSSPQSAFQLYNVTGSLGWGNGSITVRSENETADNLPSLTIANKLYIGENADFGQTGANHLDPLIGSLGFGDQNYGQIAMPGGVWHSEIVAKIPQ
ncbi:DUF6160 family protein [Alcanivorax sp. MD8A]|uniref:DUF6160 family protein n=1 Tax=Alcanivorax sp. MD8A TaxID=1177157 RepID=UPI0011AF85DD|nr:DUF6160 family protein [Alcanivorax sp. MD8A]